MFSFPGCRPAADEPSSDGCTMRILRYLAFSLIALLSPSMASTVNPLPRSILVLDQSDVRGPFYSQVFAALRAVVNAQAEFPVSIYVESLDLSRFTGPAYPESLEAHLRVKYRDKPVGVLVSVGSAATEQVLRWRSNLWPGVPLVFAMVDEEEAGRLTGAADVTGSAMKLKFEDMMTTARAVVPNLERIALLGDPLEQQTAYRHFVREIPTAAGGIEIVDLTGLPMAELRNRVATLPDRTAIIYTAIYSDGAGTYYTPSDAVALLAQVANRPIVVSFETFLGRGPIGGFLVRPSAIGEAAAGQALRVLHGEAPSSIPVTTIEAVRPIFDWRQLQRWKVDTANLPQGSEIRFRDPTVWQQYYWEILSVLVVLLFQTALIIGLLRERRGRLLAEVETRRRTAELAHVNRRATAGELSASIAHELNQPLGAILNNTETAMILLNAPSPNLEEIRETLHDIRRDDQRASEIIQRLRRLLRGAVVEEHEIDLNNIVREVFGLLSHEAASRDVALHSRLAPEMLRASGDAIQLQQVILNVVVNAMECMAGSSNGPRRIVARTALVDEHMLEISIADSGPGISSQDVTHIFEPFFSRKPNGMGMGLSIARTIVEAHRGVIWAENKPDRGAIFHIRLPAAGTH
jgi:signal transduction histidine kinase